MVLFARSHICCAGMVCYVWMSDNASFIQSMMFHTPQVSLNPDAEKIRIRAGRRVRPLQDRRSDSSKLHMCIVYRTYIELPAVGCILEVFKYIKATKTHPVLTTMAAAYVQ